MQVDFTIDVPDLAPGVPDAIQRICWVDAIAHGLSDEQWEHIDGVNYGGAYRTLDDLGDPTVRSGLKRRKDVRALDLRVKP